MAEPPCICAFPGTLRRSCAKANVKIIPDPLPATPEQALQLSNVDAVKVLRLKSITRCLQCLRQASHPAQYLTHTLVQHTKQETREKWVRLNGQGYETASPAQPLVKLASQFPCLHVRQW